LTQVPDGKEEIYSTMFSSLKHPARRKILRVLSEKPLTFSEMVELLGISSSSLTYHLENLGELVSQDNGAYRLSTFGLASVNTMKVVEEAPETPRKKRALSLKWQTILVVLLIGVVLSASLVAVEYNSLSQASSERDVLQQKYDQLLSWSSMTNEAIGFLQQVAQIDTSHYEATLLSNVVEQRSDLGGITEQVMTYALTSSDSKLDAVFRFRNNQFSRYQLIILEGNPVFSEAQSHSVLDAAKGVLDRFNSYGGADYLHNMSNLLGLVNTVDSVQMQEGNYKLNASITGEDAQIMVMYTENNVDFSPKSVDMVFQNRILTELTDDWYLFTIGSTNIKVSSEKAVQLAKDALADFTFNSNGVAISNFNVLPDPVSVVFHPNTKNALALYPQWTITFNLDKLYSGGIYRISVEVWAETGEIAQIEPLKM
jgi:hypothetical protein